MMRVGLLVPSMGDYGQQGFYNSQEIGLAKALDSIYDQVIVYQLIPNGQKEKDIKIEGSSSSVIRCIPAKKVGSNGLINVSFLDNYLDVLVLFADTQLIVPKVFGWAKKNNIKIFPYIGVVESHSNNRLKKYIKNLLFGRNIRVYKKCHCFAKTPKVEEDLKKMGVKNVTVCPVGLDLSLVKKDYEQYQEENIKKKYGYNPNDKIILFVGRFIDEKQPIRMIDIFYQIAHYDKNFKLLMIGRGELKEKVIDSVKKYDIQDRVKIVDRIPNNEMWELYCIAEAFVNLNQGEIFGMAILEAMYYNCKIIAWSAPGPDYIIGDGSGYIVSNNNQVVDLVCDTKKTCVNGYERVTKNFTWNVTAKIIKEITG